MPRRSDGQHVIVPGDGDLVAVAFRYEAYSISEDADHPAAREAARRRMSGGSTPRFEHIPGRIEQRCITAVDIGGGRYMASSNRIDGSQPDTTEPRAAYLAPDDPSGDQMTGNVVNAVLRMLNAIKPLPTKGPAI
ncbi:hypothetical protein STRCI_001294 [Streptomyces cinnabarinus]|uniref:Uncharacterized protein n=1 Tax=Streptomyces cinnabarinus TaxID=67287 RepID=A0ABY7K978_9ACTN|nr:hypothetical protein [Streptomyces cinnabarinus]WAZ20195.1 hypothetical protein STRCI_001294 [Streptomyces cinnabarinus]